jgi:hypothetical protein
MVFLISPHALTGLEAVENTRNGGFGARRPKGCMIVGVGAETMMIKNGLYSLTAVAIDGVDVEVGGVLIIVRCGLDP